MEKYSLENNYHEDPHPRRETWRMRPLSSPGLSRRPRGGPRETDQKWMKPGCGGNRSRRLAAGRRGPWRALLSFEPGKTSHSLTNPSNTEAQTGLRTEQPPIGLRLPIQANAGFRIHHNLELNVKSLSPPPCRLLNLQLHLLLVLPSTPQRYAKCTSKGHKHTGTQPSSDRTTHGPAP